MRFDLLGWRVVARRWSLASKRHGVRATVILASLAIVLTSCQGDMQLASPVGPTAAEATDGCLQYYNPDCETGPFSTNQRNLLYAMISNINVYADPVCQDIKSAATIAMDYGRVQLWSAGDGLSAPFASYDGDHHYYSEISHITPQGMSSNEAAMRSIIHETAHRLIHTGDTPDAAEHDENEAYAYEEICLGYFDSYRKARLPSTSRDRGHHD